MKVAVYAIAKNEAAHIDAWATSAKDADTVLLVDTGSTDDTVTLAQQAGITVHTRTFTPWRFDTARNTSLALIPDDIDYCIALDLDEQLQPGWRDALQVARENGWTRPRYRYTWSWNPDGSPGLVYGGDKIHARHGYTWRHPVHEVITPLGEETQGWVDLEIHHHPDPTKSRAQYLPLLRQAVDEDPHDDRNAYYYARELFFAGQSREAAEQFHRYLQLPRATWDAERSKAMRYLGSIDKTNAHKWLLKACAEAPHRREPWVDLARHYHDTRQWAACYGAAQQALNITEMPLEYLCEADAWGHQPHDLAALAAYHLNMSAAALRHGSDALAHEPDCPRLTSNLAYYKEASWNAQHVETTSTQ
jgi:glycosyltransferase involved in cell wall biosynthesis